MKKLLIILAEAVRLLIIVPGMIVCGVVAIAVWLLMAIVVPDMLSSLASTRHEAQRIAKWQRTSRMVETETPAEP